MRHLPDSGRHLNNFKLNIFGSRVSVSTGFETFFENSSISVTR